MMSRDHTAITMNAQLSQSGSGAGTSASFESLRLVSASQVTRVTNLSRTSLLRMEQEGLFPERVQLSKDRYAWVESEVQEWLEEKIKARKRRQLPEGASYLLDGKSAQNA